MKLDYWKRLADVARHVPAERRVAMPFGFDARVLSGWRAQSAGREPLPWAKLLRAALACSAVIMLLSLAMNYQTLKEREPGSVAIADSALRVSMLP